MTASIRPDASGTLGALQAAGADQLVLRTNGALLAGQLGGTAAQFDSGLSLATTAFVQRALGSMSGSSVLAGSSALTAAHAGQFIAWDGNGTLILPAPASVPDGTSITVLKYGAGSGTFASNVGSQIRVAGQGAVSTLVPGTLLGMSVFTNELQTLWDVSGDFTLKTNGQFELQTASIGFQKLPSGLIIQWGFVSGVLGGSGANVTFPIAFPNAHLNSSATAQNTQGASYAMGGGTGLQTRFGMTVFNNGTSAGSAINWMAIGC